MNKKLTLLLLSLVLIPVMLAAAPVLVTWEWTVDDPLVTTFRYQIDGEQPEGWTTVDASVTSYTADGLDGTVPHTLYLQQSYDGLHFSASAMSTSQPVAVPEPAAVSAEAPEPEAPEPAAVGIPDEEVVPVEPVASAPEEEVPAEEPVVEPEETPVVAEETPEEIQPIAEETPEEIEPIAEEETPAAPVPSPQPSPAEEEAPATGGRYNTGIVIGGGVTYMFDPLTGYDALQPQLGVGLHFNNIKTLNKVFGLGIDIDLGYTPFMEENGWDPLGFSISGITDTMGNLVHGVGAAIGPALDIDLGRIDASLGASVFGTYMLDGGDIYYGGFAKLTAAYHFTDRFSLGLAGKYGVLIKPAFDIQSPFAQGSLFFGLTF